MAPSLKLPLIIFFSCSIFLQGTLADLICETLPTNLCSFAVSSTGKRCVLENFKNNEGNLDYTCKTSEVVAESMSGHIESDDCIAACGLDRKSVGISSDAFLIPEFSSSLCSPACYHNCPNVISLYFDLAAGEGVYLPTHCENNRSGRHIEMLEVFSSSGATATATVEMADAPAPAPASY